MIKVDILVADEHREQVIRLIRENGRTGHQGDEMILISPVDETYNVRKDEKGILAI